MLKRRLFVAALLMSVSAVPVFADDVSNRMDSLEQQVRQLVGQIEELNFTVKQLQGQIAAQPKKLTSADPVAPALVPLKKKLVLDAPAKTMASGIETIEETPLQHTVAQTAPQETITSGVALPAEGAASAPKLLGELNTGAAQPADGGFQGQVLVAPGGELAASGDGVEQASLQPETPDDLFLRSEKSLLQLQYTDAEAGFKEFLQKYPEHNLAGSAQFKLGETFYAQQNYNEAAQNYLTGYKQYPKSRRAADSLMKLGLSLNKLGQKEQGCAALGSVGTEFPNAVEAKKRAQSEYKRASC